jgi:hypothetical protein
MDMVEVERHCRDECGSPRPFSGVCHSEESGGLDNAPRVISINLRVERAKGDDLVSASVLRQKSQAKRPTIDPEIAALLPALTREELAELEKKVSTEGFRDPLVVWKETGFLLDGHNRLAICEKLHIKYVIKELSFPSREQALQWVIDNQLGKRNLTDELRAYYRGKEYLTKKQQHVGQTVSDGQNVHPGETVSKSLAIKHGVNEKTIRRDAEFARAVDKIGGKDPAAKEDILSGKTGQTKQQVIDSAKADILCGRCKRVGAVQNCSTCAEERANARKKVPREPGDDTEKIKADKKAARENGKSMFDWHALESDLGKVVRHIDALGKPYGAHNSSKAEQLPAIGRIPLGP